MCSSNGIRHYLVMLSLIGWKSSQNDPWYIASASFMLGLLLWVSRPAFFLFFLMSVRFNDSSTLPLWSHDDLITWNYTHFCPFARGIPPVTGGFPSQRASNSEIWCFLWYLPEQAKIAKIVWCCKTPKGKPLSRNYYLWNSFKLPMKLCDVTRLQKVNHWVGVTTYEACSNCLKNHVWCCKTSIQKVNHWVGVTTYETH